MVWGFVGRRRDVNRCVLVYLSKAMAKGMHYAAGADSCATDSRWADAKRKQALVG